MRKSTIISLILLLILVAGLVFFFSWRDSTTTTQTIVNIPFLKPLFPSSSISTNDWPTSPRYSMQQIPLADEPGVLITMQGKFIEPLFYENEMLRGRFVVDGDLSKTPLQVFLTGQGGPFLTGIPSADGKEISWSFISTDELITRVQVQQPVELRFTIYESHSQRKEMKDRLYQLVRDESLEPFEYSISPDMISLGVPRGS